jgi:hypothetical protein
VLDEVTDITNWSMRSTPLIVAGLIVAGGLSWRRLWPEAMMLIVALILMHLSYPLKELVGLAPAVGRSRAGDRNRERLRVSRWPGRQCGAGRGRVRVDCRPTRRGPVGSDRYLGGCRYLDRRGRHGPDPGGRPLAKRHPRRLALDDPGVDRSHCANTPVAIVGPSWRGSVLALIYPEVG